MAGPRGRSISARPSLSIGRDRCNSIPRPCYFGHLEPLTLARPGMLAAAGRPNYVRFDWYKCRNLLCGSEPSAVRVKLTTPPHLRRSSRRNGERWVVSHLPLVRSVARRVRRRGLPVEEEDLVSAGTVGLIEALDRYEADRGVPFVPFAYRRIRGAMIDEIRRFRAASPDRETPSSLPLSLEMATAEDGLTLIDVTVNTSSPEPETCTELSEVLDALKLLPYRERQMLALHVAGHTLAEIGGVFGCSESRASQLVAQARFRLMEGTAT
jgi:RNA polymerase sigma factor for flagellar operon FliA